MIIRRLQSSDWQQLKLIRLECLKNTGYAFGSSYKIEEKFSDQEWQYFLTADDCFYFGIESTEHEIVAVAWIKLYPNKQWFVVGVYVKPKYRGQGIMRDLLKYLIGHTSELILNSGLPLALTVVIANSSAIKIYQQLGFKITQKLEPRQMGDGSLSEEYRMDLMISEKML